MPVELPPIPRRRFLAGSLAAGVSLAFGRTLLGGDVAVDALAGTSQEASAANRFALLSDLHIHADRGTRTRGVNQFRNLRRVCREFLSAPTAERPAAALVCGDCSLTRGDTRDYATLLSALQPVRKGGVPVHLALGNHDHRGRFRQALRPLLQEPGYREMTDRHVGVLASPHANWFLLDSLDHTNAIPGRLGSRQIAWLSSALDANPNKPALVFVHHPPGGEEALTDYRSLMAALLPRRQVKALFYGHTHFWSVSQYQGLHFINLPPVAYLFRKGDPNGWVDARLKPGGATLELRCLNPRHPRHAETHHLEWRV